jgi:hypothetical protein
MKIILISNKKYCAYMKDLQNKLNKTDISFEKFIDESTLDLIRYNSEIPQQLIKNNSVIKEFYLADQRNSKLNLYEKESFFYLIISSELVNFPLENIPILYNLPIIRCLNYSFINNDKETVINLTNKDIFFLLNPAGDLEDSENLLKPFFEKKLFLNGISGKEPKYCEVAENVKNSKMFIYCGHNNGCKYFDPIHIKYDKIDFVSILMGCQSGKIENFISKNNEPYDIPSYYHINGWYIYNYLF